MERGARDSHNRDGRDRRARFWSRARGSLGNVSGPWRRALGPLATAAALLAAESYRLSALYDPEFGMAPVAVLLLAAVVFAAAYSGLKPGLLSATAATLFIFYTYSAPGQPFRYAAAVDVRRAAIVSLAIVGVALIVGYLKERIDRLLERQRALRHEAEARRTSAEVAEQRIEEVVECVTDGFFALDRDERFVYLNRMVEQLAGRTRDELIGQKICDALPGAEQAPQCQAVRRALRDDAPLEVEAHYGALDRWFTVRAYPSPNGVSVYYQDVTEQRRSERELRESEQRLKQLTDNIREVLWISDPGMTEILYVSPAYESVWGKSREELYRDSRSWLDSVHPDDRERVEAALADVAHGGYEIEFRIARDDETRWIWSRGYPVLGEDGAVQRVVGVADDVTPRKRAEEDRELLLERERAARQQVATILERIADAFIAVDREWSIGYVNPEAREALKQLLRREPGDMMGRPLWELAPELVGTRLEEECRRAMAVQEPVHFETFFEEPGTWLDVNAYPSPQGLTLYFRDVSERKRVEEDRAELYRETQRAREEAEAARDEAREAANRFAFLAEASTLLAASLDYTDTLRSVARLAVSRIADFCLIDVIEDSRTQRVAAAHRDPALEERLALPESLPPRTGSPIDEVLRSGRPKLVEEVSEQFMLALARSLNDLDVLRALAPRSLMIVPLVSRGRTLGVVTFASTERRYGAEDASLANELARRAAVGVDNARLYRSALVANQAKSDFLAVMSHELRTPLNAILGYADLMRMGVPEPLPENGQVHVERILVSTRHLLELIEEILTFSRLEVGREEVHLEQVDLAEIVKEVAGMTEPLAQEKRLRFEVHGPPAPARVYADGRKLRQILINLLSNAVKFTDEGEITLSCRLVRGGVVFSVRDTGIGIPAEHREHVFNPFWQIEQDTARRVAGTGLGLSVTRQLAQLLGGDVHLESEPGKGSTFTVKLPLHAKEAAKRA